MAPQIKPNNRPAQFPEHKINPPIRLKPGHSEISVMIRGGDGARDHDRTIILNCDREGVIVSIRGRGSQIEVNDHPAHGAKGAIELSVGVQPDDPEIVFILLIIDLPDHDDPAVWLKGQGSGDIVTPGGINASVKTNHDLAACTEGKIGLTVCTQPSYAEVELSAGSLDLTDDHDSAVRLNGDGSGNIVDVVATPEVEGNPRQPSLPEIRIRHSIGCEPDNCEVVVAVLAHGQSDDHATIRLRRNTGNLGQP